jgi:hypothetical protein
MNVSIQEMQSIASDMGQPINISSEIGNVIEVTELNDDLGMNLLANQYRSKPEGTQRFGSSPIRLSVPDEIKPIQFDTLEPIDLNTFGNTNDSSSSSNNPLPQISISKESSPYNNYQSSSAPSISLTPAPPRDLEKERQEKIEFLNNLQRLESKGYPVSK